VLGVIQSDRPNARRSWRTVLPTRPVVPAMRPQSAKS
jgi:hypothetical protein